MNQVIRNFTFVSKIDSESYVCEDLFNISLGSVTLFKQTNISKTTPRGVVFTFINQSLIFEKIFEKNMKLSADT